MLPLARRCKSCDTSVEGGGAITEFAGMLSLELRFVTRSGAETGGGTIAALVICTGELANSRLTPPGAGGITLAARAGFERARSRGTLGAGGTTDVVSDGAFSGQSRPTLGAAGVTCGSWAGENRR